MSVWVTIILSLTAAALAAVIATGHWRRVFALFAIRPAQMTVDRLGLHVSEPANVERVNSILASFAGGFNTMITAPSVAEAKRRCAAVPVLFRAFAEEGLAMGFTPRRLFRYDAASFEDQIVKPQPEFRYLYYVGLGFWSGMRNHSPARMTRIAADLDPLHRYLCFDGYGFKHAFFDYPKQPESLTRLNSFEGYERQAAYQGVGRAFWFLFWDRPDLLIEHMGRLGANAPDAAAGLGLASVFVNADRIEVAREAAMLMPDEWRKHFHLGMCFAMKARSINDLEQFELDISSLAPSVQNAIRASVRECDRIELQVRADSVENGYERWRNRVTEWMADHIEYPLARVSGPVTDAAQDAAASAKGEMTVQ